MAEQELKSSSIEVLGTSREANFQVGSDLERARLLRDLIRSRELITVKLPDGQQFISALLDVGADNATLLIDIAKDEDTHHKALASQALQCAASLKKIKIEFVLEKVFLSSHEGHPAYQAALPTRLIRLQRREFFRPSIPVTMPVFCEIDIEDKTLKAEVVDISCGGVGLALKNVAPQVLPGSILPSVRINLPEVGLIRIDLEVRSCRNRHTPTANITQLGCKFINLPDTLVTRIQKFIYAVEREIKKSAAD